MTERRWRFRNAFKCHKCPQSHGEDGCPDWWEYPNADGRIVKGCSRHQDIKLNILMSVMHQAHCAAASADKATNHAVEGMIASQNALKSSATTASLMLGVLMGEIKPVGQQLEDRSNGVEKVLPGPRSLG